MVLHCEITFIKESALVGALASSGHCEIARPLTLYWPGSPVEVGDGILGWPGIGTEGLPLSARGEAGGAPPGCGTLGARSNVGEPTGVSTSRMVSSIGKLISVPI